MIKITITNESIDIVGHDSRLCSAISILSQYICSVIKENLIEYKSEYGVLHSKFIESELSNILIENFINLIKDINFTGIYLVDKRNGGKYEKNNKN